MPRTGLVEVVFVDAGTGQQFARTELAAAQLPDSFETATRLDLAGGPWTVVRAEPPTAAEFVASGSLLLMVSRVVDRADARDIKYSVPTFYDPLPPVEPLTGPGVTFVLHEDDWRQVELVSGRLADQVETELAAIRQIREQHSELLNEGTRAIRAFDQVHLRRAPAAPLAPPSPALSLRRLLELLPAGGKVYEGAGFWDGQGRAADSFAVAYGPLAVYGQTDGDRVTVLALAATPDPASTVVAADFTAGLERLVSEFDLLLVDWCGGRVTDVAGLGEWLPAF